MDSNSSSIAANPPTVPPARESILRCPSAKRDGPNIATRAAALVSGTEAKVDASKSYVEIVVYKFRTLGKTCINRFVQGTTWFLKSSEEP